MDRCGRWRSPPVVVSGSSRLVRELLSAHLSTIGFCVAAEGEHHPRAATAISLDTPHLVVCAVDSETELARAAVLRAQRWSGDARLVVILPPGYGRRLAAAASRLGEVVRAEDGLSALVRAVNAARAALEGRDAGGAHPAPPAAASILTTQQQRILTMVAQGWTSRRIAHELGLSRRTVDAHRANIMRRLGVTSAANLVREAIRRGLVH